VNLDRDRWLVFPLGQLERIGLQELFGLVDDFRGVPGQHALIEVFDRLMGRRVAEDDVEHDKTDREFLASPNFRYCRCAPPRCS